EVPIRPGFQCSCECPGPGSVYSNAYLRLTPGQEVELTTWDGRALSSCTVQLDCAAQGWPGLGVVSTTSFASRPVGPGSYRVNLGAEASPPAGCFSSDNVHYGCT